VVPQRDDTYPDRLQLAGSDTAPGEGARAFVAVVVDRFEQLSRRVSLVIALDEVATILGTLAPHHDDPSGDQPLTSAPTSASTRAASALMDAGLAWPHGFADGS
jgi:hypothetical protein